MCAPEDNKTDIEHYRTKSLPQTLENHTDVFCATTKTQTRLKENVVFCVNVNHVSILSL